MIKELPCKITVALSGGADSVALLYSLWFLKDELQIELSACHVNHNLRGDESDGDEMFVRRMCRLLDIPLYVRNIKVLDYVSKHESVELVARKIRYDFFSELGADRLIATAHTASDNCETVLINLIRGTALSGMCGIPPKRDNIIRPLIDCTREDIENFCKEYSLPYVTDSTNLSTDYTRNKLRINIIPELKKINPSLVTSISRMSQSVALDDLYLDDIAKRELEKARKDGKYSVLALQSLDECILRRAVAMIFDENDIPIGSLALANAVQIIRDGKGKINPCQYKFLQIRKKYLSVITDTEKFRRN
ncbi:MAG: tRNA lysidine(34) synthetase TilS [Ruminococcaceae bacterium]|nr:tRNA lysidine(34) synthetase TilS [Oscillospiraceae bacterium]